MMTEYKLYNGEVTIFHQPDPSMYYLVDRDGKKRRLSGPTTKLSVIDKPGLVPWAVGLTVDFIRKNIDLLKEDPLTILKMAREEADRQRDLAGDVGRAIHKWADDFSRGGYGEMPEENLVAQGVMAFVDWVKERGAKIEEAERVIYSRSDDYAGRLDMIVAINGKRYLGDIKTGKSIYAEALAQTAAYKYAYEEETGERLAGRLILHLSKENIEEYTRRTGNDNWRPFRELLIEDVDDTWKNTDLAAFRAAANIYSWKKEAEKRIKTLLEI